jgi:hypothetical protein
MTAYAGRRCFAHWYLTTLLMMTICGTAAADQAPDRTVELKGSYPRGFFEMPDGRLGFATYGVDGNSTVLHALSASGDSVIAVLQPGRSPFAVNDRFILAGGPGYFEVHDAHTGHKLKRKLFARFRPPSPGAHSYWLDDDVLTLIQNESYASSSMRRIRLPDLEVVERADAQVVGAYTRWQDKFVAVGYWRNDENLVPRPSITLLDRSFHVIARSDLAPNQPRDNGLCDWTYFASPYVMGDLLIYGSDCGGIRVHDLKTMRQVAARGPIDTAIGLTFANVNGRLRASGPDRGGFVVNEIALPSLQPTRVLRLSGSRFAAAGANVYAFEGNGPYGPIKVAVYGLGERTAPR